MKVTETISHCSMLNEIKIYLTSLKREPTDDLIKLYNQIRNQIWKTLLPYRLLAACKKDTQRKIAHIPLCKAITKLNALDMLTHLVSRSSIYMLLTTIQKMPNSSPIDVRLSNAVEFDKQFPLLQKIKLPAAQCQFLLQTHYITRSPLFRPPSTVAHLEKFNITDPAQSHK